MAHQAGMYSRELSNVVERGTVITAFGEKTFRMRKDVCPGSEGGYLFSVA